MAPHLIDLSPTDMERRLGEALGIYVDAMSYPRGTEEQRASMWIEHTRRHGGNTHRVRPGRNDAPAGRGRREIPVRVRVSRR